jgi:hypothetical protein
MSAPRGTTAPAGVPFRGAQEVDDLTDLRLRAFIAGHTVIATTIGGVGVSAGFMLSGSSLIVIGAAAALMLKHTKRRAAVPSSADGALRPNALRPAAASDRS